MVKLNLLFNAFEITTLRNKDNITVTHSKGNGMTINYSTCLITWTPTENQVREYEVEVEVSDVELSVTQTFTVTASL